MVTIFLPMNTPEFIIKKIQNEGANVIIKGKVCFFFFFFFFKSVVKKKLKNKKYIDI